MNTAQDHRSGMERRSLKPIRQTPFVDSQGTLVKNDRRCGNTKIRSTVGQGQPVLQDVYIARIGGRLFFWRIVPRQYVGPLLEWLAYDERDKKVLTFRRETDARIIRSMTKAQRSKRVAKPEHVPDELVECFIEQRWANLRWR